MSIFTGGRLDNLLNSAVAPGQVPFHKGRALEALTKELFEEIPGVRAFATNSVDVFRSQEIDVFLTNEGHEDGLVGFKSNIIVECKNWAAPVGAVEIAWVYTKLRMRGLRDAFIVAANGVTGDAYAKTCAESIRAHALTEKKRIVVITKEDIAGLKSADELVNLCQVRQAELFTSRGALAL